MTVRIRLQRRGARKRPFYRVVAADQRAPRDGKFIELLGTYDPLQDPPLIRLKRERVEYWIGVGAQPSDAAQHLLRRMEKGEIVDLGQDDADETALETRRSAKLERMQKRRAEVASANEKAAAEAVKAAKEKADAEKAAAAPAPAEKADAPAEKADAPAADAGSDDKPSS